MQAHRKHPILRHFAHDWATEEFVKAYLKCHHHYCRKTYKDQMEAALTNAVNDVGSDEGGNMSIDEAP